MISTYFSVVLDQDVENSARDEDLLNHPTPVVKRARGRRDPALPTIEKALQEKQTLAVGCQGIKQVRKTGYEIRPLYGRRREYGKC